MKHNIFITGDIHGKVIERFSYKQIPELKSLTKNDIVFILGDFGQPFGPSTYKEAEYVFKWLQKEKPWKTIIVGGNHDDYDFWQSCPKVNIFNGKAHQAKIQGTTFDIFFVDEISIFDIDDLHILIVPGAESHDADILLNPKDANFKNRCRALRRNGHFFRIIGQSWWPQEKMDIQKNTDFINCHANEHFDLILTHDAPALINRWFKRSGEPARRVPTQGQIFLEHLRIMLDFDSWFHGHFHFDHVWNKIYDDRICCIYKDILQIV